MKTHCLRLQPGEDLKQQIAQLCKKQNIKAACVISSVGSLKKINLRLANAKEFLVKEEFYEIISLNGTLSQDGVHLHLAAADSNGKVWGGHLMEDNLIHTTCELVVIEVSDMIFTRELDSLTGFKEIKMKTK